MTKKLPFSKAEFIRSALKEEDFPSYYSNGKPSLEIALLGRSNVGKSSLINHLLRNKSLAKVSATPGKTQTLNFFRIDNILTLVDLPGYGYAQVSKEMKKHWAEPIDLYLQKRNSLSLLLILLDSRHPLSKDDAALVKWAAHTNREHLFVFTKTDKLSSSELSQRTTALLDELRLIEGEKTLSFVCFSTKEQNARNQLIEQINTHLYGQSAWD